VYSNLCRVITASFCSLLLLALAACGGGSRPGVVPNADLVAGPSASAAPTPSTGPSPVVSPVASPSSTPSPNLGPSEGARAADAFVDSVGVNVHLGYYGTLYGDNFSAIESLLTGLGIRHVRDGISPGQTSLCSNFSRLASSGIHGDFIVGSWMSPSDVTAWDSCTARTADAYEGLNEWDTSHPATDGNWSQTDASVQEWLSSTVRSTRGVTVVAPSLTSESAYATVGALGASSDVGNAHVYFAGRNPGTAGWGGGDSFGVYGALDYDLAIARQPTGTKPMYVTESGYGDAPGTSYAVPAGTKARYLMRTLLENWNAGVTRTYVYELVDNGGGDFGSYGLTDANGIIKPAYWAVKNLLAHLSDPGASIAPGSLAYTLTEPAEVHHALFQKRDRSFVLALWLEVPEWDPSGNRSVAVAPQAARLTFGRSPSSLHTTAFDDNGNASTTGVAPAGVLTIQVGASPILLDITS
jgi:hypothetical protein